ncbi:expressed unknown protein [Seminavis robusta]|uniref:Uncharacterized protein n=1 Tax=Seminavis robusta TaxID=568900 RepID=A0A9N8HSY3_9STRA|nr:expressed unknown protein [Seminavis robusta]|eukprot:Sro1213_g252990.1 n/a (601) ;mRNA; r:18764-20856
MDPSSTDSHYHHHDHDRTSMEPLNIGDGYDDDTTSMGHTTMDSPSLVRRQMVVFFIAAVFLIVIETVVPSATATMVELATGRPLITMMTMNDPGAARTAKTMLAQLQQSRQEWIDTTLKVDYRMVNTQRAFRDPFQLPLPQQQQQRGHDDNEKADTKSTEDLTAWNRMKRKFQIKFLQIRSIVCFIDMTVGMTVLGMDLNYQKNTIYKAFPDLYGMKEDQIDELPPLVNSRTGMATWHPGWKYHALVGHMLAFTVLQVAIDALEELVQLIIDEPAHHGRETLEQKQARLQKQLRQLDAAEQEDDETIFRKPVPAELIAHFDSYLWKGDHKEENKLAMMKQPTSSFLEMLIKEASFCHTALLPAEIRIRGLLTDNPHNDNDVGSVWDQNYDMGVMQSDVALAESPDPSAGQTPHVLQSSRPDQSDFMMIGTDPKEHQSCSSHDNNMLNADYKDYFFVTSRESWTLHKEEAWRKVPFPNPSEQAYYTEFEPLVARGWVFICMSTCPWGRCPMGDIRNHVLDLTTDPAGGGRIEMEVNQVNVTSVHCMNKCCALKHEVEGDDDKQETQAFIWRPQPNGQYVFRARITDNTVWSYARFSSFIVL